MKRLLILSTALSLVLATSAAMLAQTQKDAHIGTWKLNAAKSKFNPGPGYKSETRTYTPTADGYKFEGERVNSVGVQKNVTTPSSKDEGFSEQAS